MKQHRSIRSANARRLSIVPILFDALESRTLLSGTVTTGTNFDIVPTLTKAPKLSHAIITDTKVTGSIVVTLTNTGPDASPAATVSAFLRPTGGGADINITTTPATIPSINGAVTKNGRTTDSSKNVTVNASIPLSLAAGSYTLVIEVTDSSPTGSAAQLNNTLVVPFTLSATAGFTNVNFALTDSRLPPTIVAGSSKSTSVSLIVTNNGNIPTAGGEFSVSLVLHPSSGADIPLITGAHIKSPSLGAHGGNKTYTTTVNLSAVETAAIPPGTYTLVATVTPINGTPGSPFTATGPSVTFTSAAGVGGSSILLHGDTLACTSNTQTTISPVFEIGNFETNKHVGGSYQLSNNVLTLTYNGGGQQVIDLVPIGPSVFLDPTLDGNPTSVIFSTSSTNAFAAGTDGTHNFFLRYG